MVSSTGRGAWPSSRAALAPSTRGFSASADTEALVNTSEAKSRPRNSPSGATGANQRQRHSEAGPAMPARFGRPPSKLEAR